eukprot:Polyplicarium_translucidae@DN3400_c0_g1_i2.p1
MQRVTAACALSGVAVLLGCCLAIYNGARLLHNRRLDEGSPARKAVNGMWRMDARYPCPKIFKYPLPEDWVASRSRPEAGQSDQPRDAYGLKFPDREGLYLTKHKSMGALLERALETYGSMCETKDPKDADLFWIPWWRDWGCNSNKCNVYTQNTPEEEKIFEHIQDYSVALFGVNYFTRNGGWDHVIAWSQDAVESFASKDMKFRRGFFTNLTTIAPSYGGTVFSPTSTWVHFVPQLEALPWSASHLEEMPMIRTHEISEEDNPAMTDDTNPLQTVLPVWWSQYKRRLHLIALAVGNMVGGRKKMVETCEVVSDDKCKVLITSRQASMERSIEVAEMYATSTFCLHPRGRFCPRKGIYDSWTLGCIPVVFQPCAAEYVRDFMDVQRSMVVLTREDEKRFVDVLESLSPWTIREMQLYISQHAHRLQVSKMDIPDLADLMPSLREMVLDDAFFRSFRLAHVSLLQQRRCAMIGGRYEARSRVCCPLSNRCNPMAIAAVGPANRCVTSRQVPCYFDNHLVFHLEEEGDDVAEYHDILRVAQPH